MTPRTPTRVILACLAAALGGLTFGFDTSVVNTTVAAFSEHFALTASTQGLVASISLLGCAVGAWFAGTVSERFGRVPVMVGSAVVFGACAVLAAFAPTVPLLVAARAVAGVGIGAASVMAPAYIAEVAPPRSRGRLGGMQQLCITLGILVALLVGMGVANLAGGAGSDAWGGLAAWRWVFLLELVPAALYGLAVARLPESPRYLVSRGRPDDARRVLRELSGLDAAETERTVVAIEASLEHHARTSLRDLRGTAFGLKPIVWIGLGVAAAIQLSGINAVFVYSSSLWQSVGFSEAQSLTMATVIAVVNVVVTIIAIGISDRVGRRPMLATGSVALAAALTMTAVAFAHATHGPGGSLDIPQPWATVALVGVNLVVVSFGLTWGPLGWVLLGEMFPNSVRASALAVATAVQWLTNFLVTRTFPVLADTLGLPATYGLFAVLMALATVFVLRFLPETRGRSLEETSADGRVDRPG